MEGPDNYGVKFGFVYQLLHEPLHGQRVSQVLAKPQSEHAFASRMYNVFVYAYWVAHSPGICSRKGILRISPDLSQHSYLQ